jgi:hypothetical protein
LTLVGSAIAGAVCGWWCSSHIQFRTRWMNSAFVGLAVAAIALEFWWLSGTINSVYVFLVGFATAPLAHIAFRSWIAIHIIRREGMTR